MYKIVGASWDIVVIKNSWRIVSHHKESKSKKRKVTRLYCRKRLNRFLNKYRKLPFNEVLKVIDCWIVSEVCGNGWGFVRCGQTVYLYDDHNTLVIYGKVPQGKADVLTISIGKRSGYPLDYVRGIIDNFTT